jgi:Endonuclease V
LNSFFLISFFVLRPSSFVGTNKSIALLYSRMTRDGGRWPDWSVIEVHTVTREVKFPYIPGLLSFREVPALLDAFAQLVHKPDAVMLDGQGDCSSASVWSGVPSRIVAQCVIRADWLEFSGSICPNCFRSVGWNPFPDPNPEVHRRILSVLVKLSSLEGILARFDQERGFGHRAVHPSGNIRVTVARRQRTGVMMNWSR